MAKTFNPGAFRHKIMFLSPPGSRDKDEYGDPLDSWTPFRPAMASIEPILGNELYAAFTADSKIEVKIRTRYIPGVSNDMRISHNGTGYEIISCIDVDTMHKELLCYCRGLK